MQKSEKAGSVTTVSSGPGAMGGVEPTSPTVGKSLVMRKSPINLTINCIITLFTYLGHVRVYISCAHLGRR
jgi:hypothetical protein